MSTRVGMGFDIHRLVEGRKLVLGGLELPFAKGLEGHSDGDVLLHAITDALLGATGLGDIGEWFSDTDPKHKDADSKVMLSEIVRRVTRDGYHIIHVDTILLLEEPKLKPHKDAIRSLCANLLKIQKNDLSLKAKTFERLGPIGEGRAIASYAVVTLERIKQ